MASDKEFTSSEWQTLQFAFLWAYMGVVAADGKAKPKELASLAKEISEAGLYKNPLARSVLETMRNDFANVFEAWVKDQRDALTGLRQAADILDSKVDTEEAHGFKRAVVAICNECLQANKGMFRSNNKEKMWVAAAALALRFNPSLG